MEFSTSELIRPWIIILHYNSLQINTIKWNKMSYAIFPSNYNIKQEVFGNINPIHLRTANLASRWLISNPQNSESFLIVTFHNQCHELVP